jgi:hypothetical protein
MISCSLVFKKKDNKGWSLGMSGRKGKDESFRKINQTPYVSYSILVDKCFPPSGGRKKTADHGVYIGGGLLC